MCAHVRSVNGTGLMNCLFIYCQFGVNATSDRSSVDGECLSSTTVSTGSFSTSEHEPNCTISGTSMQVSVTSLERKIVFEETI